MVTWIISQLANINWMYWIYGGDLDRTYVGGICQRMVDPKMGGFQSHGVQILMVDFMENPKQKWLMTRASPILGNHHRYP